MDSSYTSYIPLLLCFGYIEINILNYLLQTPEVDQISLVHAIYELGWFVQTLMRSFWH